MKKYTGENMPLGIPCIVTKGNDTVFVGDVVAYSPIDESLLICPIKMRPGVLQGGWFDRETLESSPEIMQFEAEVAQNRYEYHNDIFGERIISRETIEK